MDDVDLLRGQSDPFDVEALQRVGDRDHARRAAGQRPLDVAELAGAERIVVVLRRDERPLAARERAVDIRVDEVRVDDIGAAQRAAEPADEPHVEVALQRQPHRLDRKLGVERLRIPRRIVEPDKHRLDPERRKPRQQREQVTLRAADPAHPVNVRHPHERTRSQSRTTVTAAQSAIRKSHGAR